MLTLPPVVGQKYIFINTEDKKKYQCEILKEEEHHDGTTIYKSRTDDPHISDWYYWPDGEAKLDNGYPPVAKLFADVDEIVTVDSTPAIEALHKQRDAMMQRLAKLGAP